MSYVIVVGLVVVAVVVSLLYYFGYIGQKTVEVKVDLTANPSTTSSGTPSTSAPPAASPPTVTATPQVPVVAPTRKYNLKPNWDYPFNDVAYDPNVTFDQCAAACDKLPNCIGYATQKDAGKGCWYKSALVGGFGHGGRDTYLVEGRSFP